MRGSLRILISPFFQVGIIPAHAGLTHDHAERHGRSRDHPRACGAHILGTLSVLKLMGSSPRMRGSPAFPWGNTVCRRIIPAHAGLTYRCQRCESMSRDHPRACGAHFLFSSRAYAPGGSSPRMRGSLNRSIL